MGAAGNGRNQIDVAFRDQVRCVARPGQRPLDHILLGSMAPGDRLGWQPLALLQLLKQVFAQVPGVEPFLVLAGRLVAEGQAQACAQHGLGL